MVDDFVDPVDGVSPSHAIEGRETRARHVPAQPASLTGRVIAVHRRSGHHDGEHVLDTSVGAQEYTDVVIRIESQDFEDMVGKQVVLNYRP
ncbi:MAG: hypothetical protein IID09_06825 [Candidatus Hydrogenedentes bacterium]|nr:hypothetical protein [Candidatus Hydrogenedentota bacterium]